MLLDLADAPDAEVTAAYRTGAQALADAGDDHLAGLAYRALLPASEEILGPGACVFVPAREVLADLAGHLGCGPPNPSPPG